MSTGINMFLLVFVLPMLLMLGVGIYLIVASKRGRGAGHPACGACHYDLSASVGSVSRCPECGADFKVVGIAPPGARRNTPMFVTGIVLLILPLSCAGGLALLSLMSIARGSARVPTTPPPTSNTAPAEPRPMPQPDDAPPPMPHLTDDAEIDTTE